MCEKEDEIEDIDWSLTTWEGSRREQLRRWSALPLENIVAAVEEMEEIGSAFKARRKERLSDRK